MPHDSHIVRTSKFLSLILRHQPEKIGLVLDENGWADVDDLIERAKLHGRKLTLELLTTVVETNDKRRFLFSADGSKIRANQGHSVEIDLALPPREPPEQLFHGTATRFLESIRSQGLVPGSRRHVHLSPDAETAIKVGQRHGRPVVLDIQSGMMHRTGHIFFCSENGVWLTAHVPAEFIAFPE
jgi:putative RNA 2'-phosphotransferase